MFELCSSCDVWVSVLLKGQVKSSNVCAVVRLFAAVTVWCYDALFSGALAVAASYTGLPSQSYPCGEGLFFSKF
ncbi:hypothetical protein RJT34_09015 [Clitoria ternatea]|uniref:Uncharacterized protein n=1 Tax=Clitoria ternatea TaxID=43366 RepID=A0AAN9K7R9_CLITE